MRRRFINISNSVPLSFEALEDGLSISFSNEILYRINGRAWETLLAGENTEEVNKGSVISFRHAKSILGSGGVGMFSINKKCNVYGTCSSIIPKVYGEKYMASLLFQRLFSNCDTIVDASKLELPATTLANRCYYNMFGDCTSLTTAPKLPATELAEHCYSYMFNGCTNLTTAPTLPAATLAKNCYYNMFYGCTKLNYIKMLATDISAYDCLSWWVYNVASTGAFVKNPAMTSLPTGASGVPSGWTVVNDGEESGGEKTTNVLRLKPVSEGIEIGVEFNFDFPPTSQLEVRLLTDGFAGKATVPFRAHEQSGVQHSVDAEASKIQILSYTPTEDETYIYEVIVEQ